MGTVHRQYSNYFQGLCIKDKLDMITGTSQSHQQSGAVVVEDRKTVWWVGFMAHPAILPRPTSVLNFNFFRAYQNEKLIRSIACNSKITAPAVRPRSFAYPGTPCVLVCACESWQERSHCRTREPSRIGNYLFFLKIINLNSGAGYCSGDII